MEEKRHYKLYKSGKNWVVASIAALTVLSGSGLASTAVNVHAATARVSVSAYNHETLYKQIGYARAYSAANYTAASFAKLQTALNAGLKVFRNPKSNASQIKTVQDAMHNAALGLVKATANVTALQAQLKWSKAYTPAGHPNASADLFDKIAADIKTADGYVANPASASQAQVDAIAATLKKDGQAILDAKPMGANVTALQAQLKWSTAYKAENFPSASAELFTKIAADIKTAQAYVADPTSAKQADVDAIAATLKADGQAILDAKAGDATQLNKDITAAAAIVATGYTKTSFDAFQTALTAAQKVAADKTATQEAIDAADKALTTEQLALAKSADTSALQVAVLQAPKANGTEKQRTFQAAAWTTFQTILTNAQTVLGNADATQAQVDAATKSLTTATANLANFLVTPGQLDNSQLATDLLTANGYVTSSNGNKNLDGTTAYTPVSYSALTTALQIATAYNTAAATKTSVSIDVNGKAITAKAPVQADIDTVDANLAAAIKGLVTGQGPAVAADKAALNTAVASVANALNSKHMVISLTNAPVGGKVFTSVSFAAFSKAYNGAVAMQGDANASQAAVDLAKTILVNAIDGLTQISTGAVDASQLTSDLTSAIKTANLVGTTFNAAGTINAAGNKTIGGSYVYTQASFKKLTDAIAAASADFDNNGKVKVSAATITADDKALNDAIDGLKLVDANSLDTTNATVAIAAAKAILNTNNLGADGFNIYTATSFANLQTKFDAVNAALKPAAGVKLGDAQTALDKAVAALNLAATKGEGNLVEAPKSVDASQLNNDYKALLNTNNAAGVALLNADGSLINGTVANPAFTSDSIAPFTAAVKTIANLYKVAGSQLNQGVTQTQINNADKALNDAVKGLVTTTDRSPLTSAITTASKLKASDYTPASYTALTNAIATATTDSKDNLLSQETVNADVNAINDATTKLAPASNDSATTSVSAADLVAAINSNKAELAVNDNTLTDSTASLAALKVAVNAGVALFDKATIESTFNDDSVLVKGTTQAQIDAAVTAINTAAANIVKVANVSGLTDKAQLNADIKDASALNASSYSAISFASVTKALNNAATLAATATQAQINAADTAIVDAMNSLVSANKANLDAVVTGATDPANINNYGSGTGVAYEAAYKAAKKVLADPNATPAQIATATSDLINAINALGDFTAKTDYKALEAAVAAAPTAATDYTSDSYAAFSANDGAFDKANDMVAAEKAKGDDHKDYTQEDVNFALQQLKAASAKLVSVKAFNEANSKQLTKADYTKASFGKVTDAKVVLAANATQAQVDAATKNLTDAIKGLVSIKQLNTDIDAANQAISADANNGNSTFTKTSFAALQDTTNGALVKAKAAVDSADDQSADAIKKLDLALTTATKGLVNIADLKADITTYTGGDYAAKGTNSEDSWKAFQKVVTDAKALVADESTATQDQVTKADQDLILAANAFKKATPAKHNVAPTVSGNVGALGAAPTITEQSGVQGDTLTFSAPDGYTFAAADDSSYAGSGPKVTVTVGSSDSAPVLKLTPIKEQVKVKFVDTAIKNKKADFTTSATIELNYGDELTSKLLESAITALEADSTHNDLSTVAKESFTFPDAVDSISSNRLIATTENTEITVNYNSSAE